MDPKSSYEAVLAQVRKKISGKEDIIKLMFISIIANGHALLEGVPGVAKTTMTKALADSIQANFGRVQGTSDLEFKDIVGYTFIDANHNIQVKKGPIFTNIMLIDELNRAPQRTASALLEALEERQVTLGDSTIPLESPFIAFATQNPLNIEGTTPVPKVLADRFLMRIEVTYPTIDEEVNMLKLKESPVESKVERVLSIEDILGMQKAINGVSMSEDVMRHITDIVNQTRTDIHVIMGASPRAEISFMRAGKAKAFIEGRKEVAISDINSLARPILSHRIAVRSTGGIGVNGIIDGIIATSG
jgi:MoxR-like ATPase